jgi:putative membrane protein
MNECMEMMGGMMDGMGGMGGMMGGMLALWLLIGILFIGLVALGAILLLRGSVSGGWRGGESQALQLLNTRLASGDIDVQEYEQRRRLIAQR